MATNKVNGKSYVGQTINSLKKRKQEHIRHAMNNKNNSYFHNAIRKYGQWSFEWVVLDECNAFDQLNRLEVFYVGFYGTFEYGYNLTVGGNNAVGYKHTEKTKQLLSFIKKGKYTGKGNSMYNRKHSKESIKKMSDSKKGKNNNWYGRKHSEKTLKKISGENNHNACGVIVCGEYFSTLIAAAKSLNVVQTTICNRIKKKVDGYSYA